MSQTRSAAGQPPYGVDNNLYKLTVAYRREVPLGRREWGGVGGVMGADGREART